jgi:hypothetical protein
VDRHLADEIRLLGEVIANAGPYPGRLTEGEVDTVLGIPE